MMRVILTILLVLPLVAYAQPPAVSLDTPKLPSFEWTEEAQHRLARALVGEAGWLPEYRYTAQHKTAACRPGRQCFRNRDWEIIPHVLLRRWSEMRWACVRRGAPCTASGSPISFADTISSYCSPLKEHLASDRYLASVRGSELRAAQRRRFIQTIAWDGSNLLSLRATYENLLGRHAQAEYYVSGWDAIRGVVTRFGEGRLPDACPRARHWDWGGSTPAQSLRTVDCGKTLNVYSAPAWVVERWEANDG